MRNRTQERDSVIHTLQKTISLQEENMKDLKEMCVLLRLLVGAYFISIQGAEGRGGVGACTR
jgi:hypothetical protein